MGMNLRNRNVTADFIKGILILCVLYGHSISMVNQLRMVTWMDSPVNVFLTSFEMPLFIMISGYFLAFSLSGKSHGKVLLKRMKSIVIPIAVWEGIPALVEFIIATATQGFSISNLIRIAYACVFPGELWFLAAYLICSVIVLCVEWLFSKWKNTKTAAVASFCVHIVLTVGMQFVRYNINSVQFLFPFFLLGFLLAKHKLLEKKNIRITAVVLAVLFVVLYPFYKAENSFYLLYAISPGNLLSLLPVLLHRFVLGLCGSCGIYVLSRLLCRKAGTSSPVKLICRLGERTMEVYILSMYLQEILRNLLSLIVTDTAIITDVTAPVLFGPVFMTVLLAACLLVCSIIRKLPLVHKILFGR